jgi:hypothetical protein
LTMLGGTLRVSAIGIKRPPHEGIWSVRPPVDRCE